MNFFNTTMSQIDRFDHSQLPIILESIKLGSALVNDRLALKLEEI